MRRYDDPVEVRAGLVDGVEAPAQFLWRDRLWQVCGVVSHWVETDPWWQQPSVQGLLGVAERSESDQPTDTADAPDAADERGAGTAPVVSVASLVAEREVWQVDAGRGRLGVRGTFELAHDVETGRWRLVGCMD